MIAKREHALNLPTILAEALKNQPAGNLPEVSPALEQEIATTLEREPGLFEVFQRDIFTRPIPDIDYLAVTTGPGLEPALWVGINFTKALSLLWNKPLYAINHMEGHILAVLASLSNTAEKNITFPSLALLVSGGHTELILAKSWLQYEKLGATKDDAVGEAFDKVARLLGLPYPGGPEISRLAEKFETSGREQKFTLPRPMLHSGDLNFSFSGLKTAVLYTVKKIENLDEETKEMLASDFENSAIEVLTEKTITAAEQTGAQSIILGGGVAANKKLRTTLASKISERLPGVDFFVPEHSLATDNATMIALAAYLRAEAGEKPADLATLKAEGNLSF